MNKFENLNNKFGVPEYGDYLYGAPEDFT